MAWPGNQLCDLNMSHKLTKLQCHCLYNETDASSFMKLNMRVHTCHVCKVLSTTKGTINTQYVYGTLTFLLSFPSFHPIYHSQEKDYPILSFLDNPAYLRLFIQPTFIKSLLCPRYYP